MKKSKAEGIQILSLKLNPNKIFFSKSQLKKIKGGSIIGDEAEGL